MQWSSRPVILIGHGVRAAGAADIAPRLLELGIPVLASWQAKDMLNNWHPNYFGSPGIYGNRTANNVLAAADQIVAIGNRMAIWNVGYEGPRPDQHVVMVNIDGAEARKFNGANWIKQDAREFIEELNPAFRPVWLSRCRALRTPDIESPTHDDEDGYINSYRFVNALNNHLRADEVIAIDCGAAAACAFQTLRVKPPQRLISSGGLGEMGCALPYAIGASFARGKSEVLCLVGDGGLMLNLQELQTVVHHALPIKIIVFRNDSYLMIRHTERVSGMPECGVDAKTGVSFPRYQQLAFALGIEAAHVKTWQHFDTAVSALMRHKGPALLEYFMHPHQRIGPKLSYAMKDGHAVYDDFSEMSPRLYG